MFILINYRTGLRLKKVEATKIILESTGEQAETAPEFVAEFEDVLMQGNSGFWKEAWMKNLKGPSLEIAYKLKSMIKEEGYYWDHLMYIVSIG